MKAKTKTEGEGLSVVEVINQVFERVTKAGNSKKIVLLHKAHQKIADDSDWHRIRIGYMGYSSLELCKFGPNTWLLGLGSAYGDYPADPYNKDILVLPLPPKIKEEQLKGEISEEIDKIINSKINWYFQNTIIYGFKDGSLRLGRGEMAKKFAEMLKEKKESGLVARKTEIDEHLIDLSTLGSVVRSQMRWTEKTIDIFAEIIIELLK